MLDCQPPLGPLRIFAVAALVACVLGGCGGQRFPTARLEGSISVDGRSVEEGTVTFTDPTGGKGSVVARIAAGRYAVDAAPQGKLMVYFNATKETGRTVRQFDQPYSELVSVIPDRYRAGIQIEVSGDKLDQDFTLTSQP